MNSQMFTAEGLSSYRREELHASAAAIRTSRVGVGPSGSNRFGVLVSGAASAAKRLVAGTRISDRKSPATASR
jgi:hypothetical protein